MKKNIGTLDRVARLCMGIMIFGAVFFVSGMILKIILCIIALFCVYQAVVSWCAFYWLIGKNTCPIE